MNTIILPEPSLEGTMSLEKAIQQRRSIRNYRDQELSLEQISLLLWSVQGITNQRGFRTAPSAGARFPLVIYVAKKEGVYKYLPKENKLVYVHENDIRRSLSRQGFFSQAPLDIIICADYSKVTSRYGQRGIRYTDIEVGHAAQNLHLQAVAMGLGSVPVGAFNDENIRSLLDLPETEEPLYIVPVGYPVE